MKILIVSQYFWPENMRINEVARSLVERGHQVTVLTGKPNYPTGRYFPGYGFLGQARESYAGADIVRIPLLARGHTSRLRLAVNYACFALLGSLLAPFRVRGRFDAILVFAVSPLTQALPALTLKLLGRGPVHLWLLDLWPQSLSASSAVRARPLLWIAGIVSTSIHRAADTTLVCSRGFTQPLIAMGVPPQRIRYLPNFAEDLYGSSAHHPVETCELPQLPPGFLILFAGNIGASQDFSTILEAAERLRRDRSIHWIVVGDGRAATWLSQEITRRNLAGSVHRMGRFPLEAMPHLHRQADLLLVTLRRDPVFALTLPGKLQSSMAASKPILAALDGEPARVIAESRCGLCVPAGDAAALARAALFASRIPKSDLCRLGRNGRTYYDLHFDRRTVMAQLEELLAQPARVSNPALACVSGLEEERR